MTVTRPYHPLLGERLVVMSGSATSVVVRLRDGTVMRLPRAWTDAGAGTHAPCRETVFTVDALTEIIALVDALARRRSRGT